MKFLGKYYWILLPLLAWIVIRFGFNFNGLYGQDAYAYLLHAREWKAFFLGGEQPGAFFWPPNYSIAAAFFALVIKTEFYSLQLISVFSMIGLAGVLNAWFKQAFKEASALIRISFVSLTFLFSPYLFRLGMQSMSDMLAMLLLTASFWYLWRYLKGEKSSDLLLWAGFSALALTTRYPAIVVLFPSILFVGFTLAKKNRFGLLLAGLLVALVPISLAVFWKLKTSGWNQAVPTDLLADWSLSNYFKTDFQRPDTNYSFLFPNLLFNLSLFVHPGTLFFGALLMLFALKDLQEDKFRVLLLVSILGYLLFLSGIPFQNSRVLVLTYPLVAMFFAPAFCQAISWLRAKNLPIKVVIGFVLLIQIALCARAMLPSIKSSLFEAELVTWISENCTGKTVYTSSFSQLFDVYETGNPVVQIYDSEIESFYSNSIFVFNESLVDFKLKGTMPLQNWNSAKQAMQVEELKCWSNGWCVYSLESK